MNKEFLNKVKVYCVYHKPESKFEYNLVESDWFKPYYVKGNHQNSLDCLQEIFNEYTAQFYVYRNNLRSDYVGFCHYRRQYIKQYVEMLVDEKNFKLYGRYDFKDKLSSIYNINFDNFFTDDLYTYIKAKYKPTDKIYKYFINNKDNEYYFLRFESYICKWDDFCVLQDFLTGFTIYIDKKYKLKFKLSNYKKFIQEKWIDSGHLYRCLSNSPWYKGLNKYRIFGYFYELLIGFYFGNLKLEYK